MAAPQGSHDAGMLALPVGDCCMNCWVRPCDGGLAGLGFGAGLWWKPGTLLWPVAFVPSGFILEPLYVSGTSKQVFGWTNEKDFDGPPNHFSGEFGGYKI